ncbi:hypothetical protein BHM03_00012853 [Ensete ventricosum]|nr:hypothetical protein BHM03_00012853 [Ensete ventricosum]
MGWLFNCSRLGGEEGGGGRGANLEENTIGKLCFGVRGACSEAKGEKMLVVGKKREKKKREKPVPRALLFPDSPCDPSPWRSVACGRFFSSRGEKNEATCRAVPSIPVGYLSASIRSVADARVGDTITHFGRRAASSLPGYEKATPMVFCGLFPVDADQ